MKQLLAVKLGKIITEIPVHNKEFELSDSEKINKIEHHFTQIMQILGLIFMMTACVIRQNE